MKPVTFMEDSFHKLLGEQGMYVLDTIVNKWLDFVEPMMKFFLLPWIKVSAKFEFIYFHTCDKKNHTFSYLC